MLRFTGMEVQADDASSGARLGVGPGGERSELSLVHRAGAAQCGRLKAGPRGCTMPAAGRKLTDFPEIVAYVLAHAAGIAWGMTVTPMILRSLIAQGYADHLRGAAAAHGIAV